MSAKKKIGVLGASGYTGADAVRLYMLFIGPADEDMDWTDGGVDGMVEQLRRVGQQRGHAQADAHQGQADRRGGGG